MKNYILIVYIIALCVSPTFALGEGNRNLLLIGLMGTAPMVLFYKPQILPKIDISCTLICLALISFPLLVHPETMRWSTVLYSCMFFLLFTAIVRLLTWVDFTLHQYVNLLRWLIYAFAVVLIVQQICVLTGMPIFNVSNYDLLEPWKLNSLTSEPSHTARLMTILMYSFLWMQRLEHDGEKLNWKASYREDKWVWRAFLWVMLTMMSGTAMLMLCILLLSYLNGKYIINIVIGITVVIVISNKIEFKPVQRFMNFGEAALSMDKNRMSTVDHSASMRVVPFLICAEQVDLNTVEGWCGKGIDYGTRTLHKSIRGVKKGYTAGGFALVALEYGFIVFTMLTIFTFIFCYNPRDKVVSIILWFLCCFSLGVNTQIGWSLIILSYINKYFNKKVVETQDKTQTANKSLWLLAWKRQRTGS